MKTQAVVELVTDAVTDAVREILPGLIAAQVEARISQAVKPALDAMEHSLGGIQASVQARVTDLQADVARRGIAQADALTNSWELQVKALRESIAEQVAGAVTTLAAPAGPAGPAGPPGRDATFTPPVHWQAATGYTRGAVVMHRNGLWYANQDTAAEPGSGVDGYSLLFDGHELQGYTHDARGFQLAVYRYASGKVREVPTGERPFRYCGVYDHGTNYYLNDCVTANGSMWMHTAPESCNVRPGGDDSRTAWTLSSKCGRDGRDGAAGPQGPKGDPGAQGPPGETVVRAPKQRANGASV